MSNSVFDSRALRDEQAAFAYIERRLWPNGPVCPHCGATADHIGKLANQRTKPSNANPEGKPILGLYKCYACRKPFTVRVGTIFEDSHVPMHLWLQAIVMMCASKKGISTNQLHRVLGVTLRTAWHMSHRIREAMSETGDVFSPIGGAGKILEIDETFYGQQENGGMEPWQFSNERGWRRRKTGYSGRIPVVTLVERGGRARSIHAENVTAAELRRIVFAHADTNSALMTDQARAYRAIGRRFASHESVNHGEEEYVRRLDDGTKAHTNTVEGFFSIFKRGMVGVYQRCDERHLHRYLAEFDFRYSNRIALGVNDTEWAARTLDGAVGKRLTYRTTRSQAAPIPPA